MVDSGYTPMGPADFRSPEESIQDAAGNYSFVGEGQGNFDKVTFVQPAKYRLKDSAVAAAAFLLLSVVAATSIFVGRTFPIASAPASREVMPRHPDVATLPSGEREAAVSAVAAPVALESAPASSPVLDSVAVATQAPPRLATVVVKPNAEPLQYNCLRNLPNASMAWSPMKRNWCCDHQNRGCPVPPFNCRKEDVASGASATHWLPIKQRWCCQHRNVGCPSFPDSEADKMALLARIAVETTPAPHNCSAGADMWEIAWSLEKMAWCCKQVGRGCRQKISTPAPVQAAPAAPNCSKGVASLEISWSLDKMAWCCEQVGLGCQKQLSTPGPVQGVLGEPPVHYDFDCSGPTSAWSTEQQTWCYWKLHPMALQVEGAQKSGSVPGPEQAAPQATAAQAPPTPPAQPDTTRELPPLRWAKKMRETTMPSAPPDPATCKVLGCGAYQRGSPCACNAKCAKYRDCCKDYSDQCWAGTERSGVVRSFGSAGRSFGDGEVMPISWKK